MDSSHFAFDHEYIIAYAKKASLCKLNLDPDAEVTSNYNFSDERGNYLLRRLDQVSLGYVPSLDFTIYDEKGVPYNVPQPDPLVKKARWRWGRDTVKEKFNELVFKDGFVYTKVYEKDGSIPRTLLVEDRFGRTRTGKSDFRAVVNSDLFSNPKPVKLIEFIIKISTLGDDLILDFFAGSGTTAQAVISANCSDSSNRSSVSVQMPEVLDKDSEAYKAGYSTIAEITRTRIDKVIAKFKAEHPDKTQDLACAHFTLAPSNFKVWRGDVNDAKALREQLAMFQSAEKAEQKQQADAQTAMLTELLLKHGLGALGVHAIAKPRQVAGVTVHRVLTADDKTMWLCFETYTDALKDEIAQAKPAQMVMLNSCFVGTKADEQLANLQLELAGLDIGLTVI